jgi:hypothetical protein
MTTEDKGRQSTFDVIMAGYQAIEPAKKDFEQLVGLV